MPKVTAATLAVTALIVLGLTGCAGTPESTGDERATPAASTTPTDSPEPLAAEGGTLGTTDADTKFLAYVRGALLPETQIPNATDEQLIEAGHEACGQLESGVALEDVRVVDGETAHPSTGAYYDSSAIMGGAILSYCPEFA